MSIASSRAAAAPAVAPASCSPDAGRQLEALRAELDGVDDAMHDLLMRRAELVAQVGALGAKGRVPLRPGREASILRRLMARNHGALAPATLVRVWREMLAGSSAQQNAMQVVAGHPALQATVCEQFGALMRADIATPEAALAQVRDGQAALAVLPLPGDGIVWWTELLEERWPRLQVVSRLPFWSRPGVPEALVVGAVAPDPSGHDRSLVAGPPDALRRAGADRVLASAGPIALAELDGLMTAEAMREPSVTVVGAYAIQMGDET